LRFGKEVPALLVYDETGEHPIDVYPKLLVYDETGEHPIDVYPKQVIERYTMVLRHLATINQFLRESTGSP